MKPSEPIEPTDQQTMSSSSRIASMGDSGSFFTPSAPKSFASFGFLPDFVEHPKPKKKKAVTVAPVAEAAPLAEPSNGENDVSFWQDFVAGGIAGSASVVVGHPMDSMKVRAQTSNMGIMASITEFGGVSSLFRGMGPPLSAAAAVNAIVFSSYGVGSRFWDANIQDPSLTAHLDQPHDVWYKAMACGSFAGLVQCLVICPMEHIKCRLQVQHKGSANNFKGPLQATQTILRNHGLSRLYQGWWSTVWREVPAFGLYFASYDYIKDKTNTFLARQAGIEDLNHADMQHSHTWVASAFAGGVAGALTWGLVYPVDVIKTKIQTAPLDTPVSNFSLYRMGSSIVAQHGWRYLFRGMSITLLRAFPVNGTIFPIYEFVNMQMSKQ